MLVCGDAIDEPGAIRIDNQAPVMLILDKPLFHHELEKGKQARIKTGDIQECAGFPVKTQLRPRIDLEYLLKRADTARQSHKGVRQVGHHHLPLVHRGNAAKLGKVFVGDLFFQKSPGYDAGYSPACIERTISDCAHQSHIAAPKDKFDAAKGKKPPELRRGSDVFGKNTGT